MMPSMLWLVHAHSGSLLATLVSIRVAKVDSMWTDHSSSPGIDTLNHHGVIHSMSISHWTASLPVAELK